MSRSIIPMKKGIFCFNSDLSGASVIIDDLVTDIDDGILLDVIASYIRSRIISNLEQMDRKEIFDFIGIGDKDGSSGSV